LLDSLLQEIVSEYKNEDVSNHYRIWSSMKNHFL